MAIDPVTGAIIVNAVGSAVGGAFGGQGQPDPKDAGDLHLANSGQLDLWNAMARRAMGGGGDFGFGKNVKQGTSQIQNMMAQRGISPQSGTGMGALASMIGTASAGDAANRDNYMMNLLRSPLQVEQTAGSNWINSSPSFGYDSEAQWGHFAPGQQDYHGKYGYAWQNDPAAALRRQGRRGIG